MDFLVKSFFRVNWKTVRVRKGTIAGGVGGSAGFEQKSGFTRLSFCSLEACFNQQQGITILYRLGRDFLVKSFFRLTRKTVRVRKGTMSGGGAVQGK